MATTVTLTPQVADRSIRVRVERDDAASAPSVDYASTSLARSEAELAAWTGQESSSNATTSRVQIALAGSATASRTLSGLTIGTLYLIELTTQGTTAAVRVQVTGKSTVNFQTKYGMTYRAEFTATATSHTLTVTNLNASINLLEFNALKVSARSSSQLVLGPNFASGGDSVWTGGTGPSGTSYSKSMSFTGTTPAFYTLNQNYEVTPLGTSVVFTPRTMLSRTLSGLTIGVKYRITVNASAAYMASGGASTTTNFYWAVGVTGKGSGNVILGQGVSILEFTATATSHVVTIGNTQAFQPFGTSFYDVYLLGHQFMVERVPSDIETDFTISTLTRSDRNGTRQVRLEEGTPTLVDGVYEIDDFEHALSGNVSYTAVVTSPLGGSQFGQTAINVTDLWDVSTIAPAVLPRLGSEARIVETYGAEYGTSSSVHQVIGRADPLVTLGVQRLRTGTMRIFAEDYNTALAHVRTAGRGNVLIWRQPDYTSLDMYFVANTVSVTPYDPTSAERRWAVVVEFVEVLPPVAPLLGTIAWNFERSTSRNATFLDSLMEFPTFTALLIGPGDAPL